MSVLSSDSLITNASVNNETTTAFVDSGPDKMVDLVHSTVTDLPSSGMSIPQFMARPYLYRTGTFTTASVVGSTLVSDSIATVLMGNAQWVNKMYGYNLVRGTCCVKLTVNANPFQQGRLLLHFLPSNTNTTKIAMHNASRATKTTQPGVELDLRMQSVTMKIPYISPSNYFDVGDVTNRYDWGTLYISVLSALRTGASGDTAVTYTAYMWFEDFELIAPIIPQSSAKAYSKKKGKSLISTEQERVSDKPISKALSQFSSATGGLGDAIPVLAPFTGPVSWAVGVASGVASYFGWSKPLLTSTPTIMAQQVFRYGATSDGPSSAFPLALTSDNTLKIMSENSGRGYDEMSFDFLKQVPAIIDSFLFREVDTQDTVLYTKSIFPQNLYEVQTKSSGAVVATYHSGPPLHTLGYMFEYYRGTIVVRLSMVKTMFHSGRLQVVFTPIYRTGLVPAPVSSSQMALRTIVDVKECEELEIELPYLLPFDYMYTNQRMGVLEIRVLNVLKVPETASSELDVLVSYRGGADFELQGPIGISNVWGPFTPEADFDYNSLRVSPGVKMGMPISIEHSERCIGEHFTSVKQLISRMASIGYQTSGPTFSVTSTSGWAYWPWHTSIWSIAAGVVSSDNYSPGAYDFVAQWYCFFRGSVSVATEITNARASLINYGVTGTNTVQTQVVLPSGSMQTGVGFNNARSGLNATGMVGTTFGDNISGLGAVYHVPYQSATHCSLVPCATTVRMGTLGAYDQPTTRALITTKYGTGSTASSNVCRMFGDDFQLSYFMGTVPILISAV